MPAKTSLKISAVSFVVWCAFNLVVTGTGSLGSPWHESRWYVGFGLVFAGLTAGFAWHARRHGQDTLSPMARTFAGWMMLASLSFVLVVLMAFAGWA